MARIKIKDLPKDMRISKEELKRIKGGAFDAFLKIDGISGECQDDKHKSEADIISFSYPTR
jgi:type VI protein secretion system component Hcp